MYLSELSAHYAAVRARVNPPPVVVPAPLPMVREPVVVPVKRGRRKAMEYGVYGCPPRMSWRSIIQEVAMDHGIMPGDLRATTRRRPVALARQEAMYRLRVERGFSSAKIGQFLGQRDHTTVLHGVKAHALRNGLPVPEGRQ